MMTERELPLGDVRDLAEQAMSDKRRDGSDEAETRELYDLTESPEPPGDGEEPGAS